MKNSRAVHQARSRTDLMAALIFGELRMRKMHDNYPTPLSIVKELVNRWVAPDSTVWEPCSGDGRFAHEMRKTGCRVLTTDISTGQNFFDYTRTMSQTVVTNPPFKDIRPFIDHAFAIGVQKMALVCPERLWACRKGRDQFIRFTPTCWVNMDWREDYLQKGGSPDRALAVAIWEKPHGEQCRYEVWSRSS